MTCNLRYKIRQIILNDTPDHSLRDEYLQLKRVNKKNVLRNVLKEFGKKQLEILLSAIESGDLVRGVFTAGPGRGCLFYHLFGCKSTSDYLNYFDDNIVLDAARLVRLFDSKLLSDDEIRLCIEDLIAKDRSTLAKVDSATAAQAMATAC